MSWFFLFFFPGLLALTAFIFFLFGRALPLWLFRITELLCVLVLPALFISALDLDMANRCCGDSAFFSPAHRPTLYTVIVLCMACYFISTFRTRMAPPIIEVLLNCLLIIGIVLNVFIGIHEQEGLWVIGNVPILLLFIMRLARNHQQFLAEKHDRHGRNALEKGCLDLLHASAFAKFPLLLVICLPVLALIAGAMMLFGQRPDAMIRAFTDTYKHGLSQLDHECQDAICGEHFLCTVAARGHAPLVSPERLGVRNGGLVICNRQLLVSNAFEEIIQQWAPNAHRVIRSNYNVLGSMIHAHYHVLDRKWVSDLIYVAMKPMEWFFLLVLYCCDRTPENRIAQQYLLPAHRQELGA